MIDSINQTQIEAIKNNPNYKLLSRVPEHFAALSAGEERVFVATIIDLETTGMDAKRDEIIELGLLSFSFSNQAGIVNVCATYNELNEPSQPISAEITKITGITNEDVKGKAIDWIKISQLLQKSHLIICHNSRFDRNFLELQSTETIREIVEKKPFACTLLDIAWRDRGYESSKLEYLNFKLGYFYEGHRALVDCWATFNLLVQEPGAFDELKDNVRKKETLICAKNAPFEKKDALKERKYRWSDGTGSLPKCWWIIVSHEHLIEERIWLDEIVYEKGGASAQLPVIEISAHKRYSYRAEILP